MESQFPTNFLQENFSKILHIPSASLILPPTSYASLSQITDPSRTENSDSTSESTNVHDQERISTSSKKIHKISHNRKDKYSVIPNRVRVELIDAVLNKKEKIKRAASRLGINYSSAKSIFQVYRREGRSDKKISKKSKGKQDLLNNDFTETNLTNLSNNLASPKNPIALPELLSTQTKTRGPSILSSDCLLSLDKLAIKLQSSEAHSDCSTAKTLNFSRNCSGTSTNYHQSPNNEAPTFFSILNKDHVSNDSNMSAVLRVSNPNIYVKEEADVQVPRYQAIANSQDLQALSLLKLKQDQSNLVTEIMRNKILNQQLNQLKQLNTFNTLLLQQQCAPKLSEIAEWTPKENVNPIYFPSCNLERKYEPKTMLLGRELQRMKVEEAEVKIPPFNPRY